jgi:hypothetical protein
MKELRELIIGNNRSIEKTTMSPNRSKHYNMLRGDTAISSSSSKCDGRWADKCDTDEEMPLDRNNITMGFGLDMIGDH